MPSGVRILSPAFMRDSTLCLLVRDNPSKQLLLGLQKRGFGEGKLDGFGGKVEESESVEEAAVRELFEETSVRASVEALSKIGELIFEFPAKQEWTQLVHVFLVKDWVGEPQESEEMKPEWVDVENLPFKRMWQCDRQWVPLVLNGKRLKGRLVFNEDNESLKEIELEESGP